MNPAIIFAPIAREVRSVILASGTLTPMSSFLSELGVHFHYKPILRHVITKEQMYVRCIPHGPTGKLLSAKFDKVNSFDFQVREESLTITFLFLFCLLSLTRVKIIPK